MTSGYEKPDEYATPRGIAEGIQNVDPGLRKRLANGTILFTTVNGSDGLVTDVGTANYPRTYR